MDSMIGLGNTLNLKTKNVFSLEGGGGETAP